MAPHRAIVRILVLALTLGQAYAQTPPNSQYEQTGDSVVDVKVLYFTLCPHCEYFLTLGLTQLVEAQLPGNKVQITVVPMYPPLLQAIRDPSMCKDNDMCHLALAPLCAFSGTFDPSPADSEELRRGVRFAVCDLRDTANGRGRSDQQTARCAEQAGLGWDKLRTCTEGPEAIDLLGLGSKPLLDAMKQLHDVTGFQMPPSMPWILLDGELLSCDGPGATCTHRQTPAGYVKLKQAGTLLDLVCANLHPRPDACSAEGPAAGAGAIQQKTELEDADSGLGAWRRGAVPLPSAICGALLVTLVAWLGSAAVLAMRRKLSRALAPSTVSVAQLPKAFLE